MNENGSLNPKYNGATVRDASDYLVYDFFAAVKKIKEGLGWYGVRTAEPHHDGIATLAYAGIHFPGERIERIIEIMREAAIKSDRYELGTIFHRALNAREDRPEKGTPANYIATYIGKNTDASAFHNNDPKTKENLTLMRNPGKPWRKPWRTPLHRQTFTASVSSSFRHSALAVWRELRRLAKPGMERNPASPKHLDHDDIDAIMAAADVGCFATYIMKQGGVLIPRNQYLVRTAYETADEANDYGELLNVSTESAPRRSESGTPYAPHPDEWKLVKKETIPDNPLLGEGFDLQGIVAPWTTCK